MISPEEEKGLMSTDQFAQLLRAARSGSRQALGKLLESLRDRLHRLASHHIERELLPKNSPSDLVQDTLLAACCAIGQFRGESGKEFEAWVTRILVNNVNNVRRTYRDSRKREVKRESPLSSIKSTVKPMSPADDQVVRDERVGRLRQALDQLPSQERRVLAMRFWERRSFESIGLQEHRSAEAARKLCTRAMKKLGKVLYPPAGS